MTARQRLLREGSGWRVGRDPDREPYCVLIGGATWATELCPSEAEALTRLLRRLVDQHGCLADQLMAEETIVISADDGDWWLELEGDRDAWSLRFVLTGTGSNRGVEGQWPAPAAMAMAQALLSDGGW